MNSGPLLFLGLFVTMVFSWLSFILGPQLQIGDMRPTTNIVSGGSGQIYPNPEPGTAHQGAEIYRANGCVACHTQQVRPRDLGSDINRGWGLRRSTAYDYLFDQPALLGSLRVGPDLANAGKRMDATAVLLHLYEPRAITPGSFMPPFPFLFEKHKIKGFPSADALQIPPAFAPPPGYEIIPLPSARALAAYVTSLHQDGYLFEAPPPPSPPRKNERARGGPGLNQFASEMSPYDAKNPAQREADEPRAGDVTVPMWMVALFGLLALWGELYVSGHAGGFDKQVYAPFQSIEQVASMNPKSAGDEVYLMGQDVFSKTCTACHQPNGMGKEGVAPPLVASEWVLAPGPNRIAHVALYGLTGPITVKGKEWNLAMVPWKDTFDDQHIAAALTYVRNTWGNKGSIVTAAQVAAARKENHRGPETAAELLQMPETAP